MSFESLGLAPGLVRALAELGYTTPTPIQEQAIPFALEGRDMLAGAQTGTGKTAAFSLPLLHRLAQGEPRRGARAPRALVLTPTRELALQVHESVRDYGKHVRLQSAAIYGGAGMNPQLDALRRGLDILVATPGRLIDHMERRSVDLSKIEILVLDEADRMLDMGFLPAMKRIITTLPKQNRQTLLFSATFAEPIKQLAQQFMRNPVEVQVTPKNTVVATIEHRAHPVDAGRKKDLLLHLMAQDSRRQTLVFTRTKHGANRLAEQLEAAGMKAAAIHGNKSQGARTKALSEFKSGKCTVLVATDIAARGIDIDQLPVVINYDLPTIAEDYVHRIGRTGRNGSTGEAISLVSPEEGPLLRDIQKLLNADISLAPVAGFEPSRPLQMNGSLAAARRPANARPSGRPAQRPGAAAHRPRTPNANAGGRGAAPAGRGASSGRGGNGGQRRQGTTRF
ncbi:DEAD/DEAH box helicase [Chiayiivirga flava]|uniref:DEAD-box ATP-dependent RNA helicase RhpA n=1 Tax=Chiayiivirga flava TaxID=659595 RepID=A0A7W8G348_9GAMM|nr:DEAD/DEAH box helicase [Chiayiivirga flava]MBB5209375.1 ATP-dependent RNA helicase RhlE [Chiayiivirga flava]